jgi:hypothetical protein
MRNQLTKQLGDFFEKGFGKLLLIVIVLAVSFYVVYFAVVTSIPKEYLPNQLIALKQNRDFLLGRNEAGYGGYIRFETKTTQYPGSQPQQSSTVKIILKFRKDSQYRHSVAIELLDKNRRLISETALDKSSFELIKSGYSYNIVPLEFPGPSSLDDAHYFRYSLTAK